MRTRTVLVVLVALAVVPALGSATVPDGKSAARKEFERLYEAYSRRFHESMIVGAETMQPAEIAAEAARLWDETFALHTDVLQARVKEVLGDLNDALPIQEDMYLEVASLTRPEPKEQPKGIVLKQVLWTPLGAAQMGLDTLLGRILNPQSNTLRKSLISHAALPWTALDRNLDHPRLVQRQGPMLYVVDLGRKDDYYQVDRIRWLRPKSMGPILPSPPPAATPPLSGELPH